MICRLLLVLALASCRWNFGLVGDDAPPAMTDDAGFIVDDGGTRVPCTVDTDCGRCQRCAEQFCQRATFVEVGIAQRNACALDELGELWCWGLNTYFTVNSDLPFDTVITRPHRRTEPQAPFDRLAVGWGLIYLRSTSGALVSRGSLDGDVLDTTQTWTDVQAANFNGCGVTATGAIYCSGDNLFGQLGRTTAGTNAQPLGQFGTLTGYWSQVSPGDTTCAINTSNQLLCVGNNDSGELGRGFTSAEEADIVQVGSAMDWATVAVGQVHVCALTQGGTLWCWGDLLLPGDDTVPVQVGAETDWSGLDSYYETSCAVRGGTQLWCTSTNNGALTALIGTGATAWTQLPVTLDPGTAPEVGASVICVKQTGQWVCWGDNVDGVVGVGAGPGLVQPTPLCE